MSPLEGSLCHCLEPHVGHLRRGAMVARSIDVVVQNFIIHHLQDTQCAQPPVKAKVHFCHSTSPNRLHQEERLGSSKRYLYYDEAICLVLYTVGSSRHSRLRVRSGSSKVPFTTCHRSDSLYSAGKRYIPNLLLEVEA